MVLSCRQKYLQWHRLECILMNSEFVLSPFNNPSHFQFLKVAHA